MATILRFDRLDDGTLVASHTHDGRTVAAIVHPHRPRLGSHASLDDFVRPWSLAGDLTPHTSRPGGESGSASKSCAQAAAALGVELDVPIDGYEVTR